MNQFNQLSEFQKEAVNCINGSLLVVAGAGSGKTRIITSRIINLINQNNNSGNIIALTFTNKAANEMKERVVKNLDFNHKMPFVGTFHSYCLALLKKNSTLLFNQQFSLIDEDDKKNLISSFLKKSSLNKKYSPQQICSYISLQKNGAINKNEIIRQHDQTDINELYQAYENEKRLNRCLDFDDLLLETVKLFEKNENFAKKHQEAIRHILIDEYQDTNFVQHHLLKLMTLCNKELSIDSVCVVGDQDQSIYSWRGATADNILKFQSDFKNTKIVKIEQNYRSKQPILEIANQVIKNNQTRIEKNLWSDKQATDCVRSLKCYSANQESEVISSFIKIINQHQNEKTIAILYRTHAQSRVIEESLIKKTIAYKIIGGIKFYERKEIKDIVAYLKLILNPFDKISARRIINCPNRGLGDAFQESFFNYWSDNPFCNFFQITEHYSKMNSRGCKTIEDLANRLSIFNSSCNSTETINLILSFTKYNDFIKESYEPNEAHDRLANINELLNACHHFETEGKESISDLLDEISLLQDIDNKNISQVLLMTIHAAKGLEFDIVIMSGLEESIFPSSRSLIAMSQLEEERRLFYVAMTRAKEKILFLHAQQRQIYGPTEQMIQSRFLNETRSKNCKEDDVSNWYPSKIESYFLDWLSIKHHIEIPRTYSNPIEKLSTLSNHRSKDVKKNQLVFHEIFGNGIIEQIEEKNDRIFAIVRFKTETKKIDHSFLKNIN